jgi:hypothetical protein
MGEGVRKRGSGACTAFPPAETLWVDCRRMQSEWPTPEALGYWRWLQTEVKQLANAGVEPTTLALLAPRSNQLS